MCVFEHEQMEGPGYYLLCYPGCLPLCCCWACLKKSCYSQWLHCFHWRPGPGAVLYHLGMPQRLAMAAAVPALSPEQGNTAASDPLSACQHIQHFVLASLQR